MSENESPDTDYPEDCAEVFHLLRTLKPSVSPRLESNLMFEAGRIEGNASALRAHSRWAERLAYAFVGVLLGSSSMLLIPQLVNGNVHRGDQTSVAVQRSAAAQTVERDVESLSSFDAFSPNEIRFIRMDFDAKLEELANTGAIASESERLMELAGPELVGPSEVFTYGNFHRLLMAGG